MSALLIAATSVVLSNLFEVAEAKPRETQQVQHAGAWRQADSLEARRLAAESVQRFLLAWRQEWLSSERARLRLDIANADRAFHAHCHHLAFAVRSANGGFGKCPSWLLTNRHPLVDEADARDAAISHPSRARIQSDRAALLVTLESLQRRAPRDVFIVGQRIRFMVDEGRLDEAIRTATRCAADPVWCAALRGFALASRGRAAAADSAFELVAQLMPTATRCEWTDIGALLHRAEREDYRSRSCAERDSLARQYWWLARPLLHDVAGPHLRRVEHYRRKVLVLLHASLPFDELHDMRPSHGGDAVAELLLRYGWPTVIAWAGDSVDKDHDKYLEAHKVPVARPYTTAEYSPGRVRFSAPWSTVIDPFHADTLTWELRPPPSLKEDGSGDAWRPVEHMRFTGGAVTQLPAGQTAFFRRSRTLRVLTAMETGTALKNASGETPLATLVISTIADSVVIVAESPVSNTGRLEFSGEIDARPMLIGIESIGTPSHPLVARTRFGAVPPLPLDSLPPGHLAISEPVFFEVKGTRDHPRDLGALSQAMLGSTAVVRGGKVGLYWETYGVTSSDSVRYTLQINRLEPVGLLHRIGATLRVIELPATSVAVSWFETRRAESQDAADAVPSIVSIATGSIDIDVSLLPSGRYFVEVAATVEGRTAARAGRQLTIR